jgi:hypothetical protein
MRRYTPLERWPLEAPGLGWLVDMADPRHQDEAGRSKRRDPPRLPFRTSFASDVTRMSVHTSASPTVVMSIAVIRPRAHDHGGWDAARRNRRHRSARDGEAG